MRSLAWAPDDLRYAAGPTYDAALAAGLRAASQAQSSADLKRLGCTAPRGAAAQENVALACAPSECGAALAALVTVDAHARLTANATRYRGVAVVRMNKCTLAVGGV